MSQTTQQRTSRKRLKPAGAVIRGTNGHRAVRRDRREGFTLGHAAFAKICAVEGLYFTGEMVRDLQELDRRGLSPEERREFS